MRAFLVAAVAATLLLACDPYQQRSGEDYAGAVDPAAFPAPYLGAGGDPKRGGGVIVASAATAHGAPAPYYAFAVSAAQAAADDPLAISTGGSATAIAAPLAYAFDPRPATSEPFPAAPRCTPPSGYTYDARRDGYRLDEQGNVFTALPTAGYAPIVAEVPVTSNGEPCQSIKSAATLVTAATTATSRCAARRRAPSPAPATAPTPSPNSARPTPSRSTRAPPTTSTRS